MWNDLTLSDKRRMIALAVRSGITDLNTIHEVYNKFAEGGPKKVGKYNDPIKEQQFQNWYSSYSKANNLNENPDAKEHYYDYRRYWEETNGFDRQQAASLNGHLPDTYKLPGHPTFSNQSIYARKNRREPKWDVRYTPMPEEYLRRETEKERIERVNGVVPKPKIQVPTVSSNYVLNDVAARVFATENNKDNPKGGYDRKNNRWLPVDSVEGGTPTVAYGIKLGTGSPEAKLAEKQGYLTDKQANDAVYTLSRFHINKAKEIYDNKFGEGNWDKLSPKSQSILADYSFNVGLQKFPKLMEGFHSGNIDTIRKEYKRFTNGRPLTGRNNYIKNDIDSLQTFYPIILK